MKHANLFGAFLRDVVDLNPTRITTLEERVQAVQSFLRSANYRARIRRFSPQGSWAHGTVIRPPRDRDEFDADFLMIVEEVEDWDPKEYVNALYRAFSASSRYEDKVKHRTRCVRIDYAGDFHLDVVPCIERKGPVSTTYWVLTGYQPGGADRAGRLHEVVAATQREDWRQYAAQGNPAGEVPA